MHAIFALIVLYFVLWWKDLKLGERIIEKQRHLRELDMTIHARQQALNPEI